MPCAHECLRPFQRHRARVPHPRNAPLAEARSGYSRQTGSHCRVRPQKHPGSGDRFRYEWEYFASSDRSMTAARFARQPGYSLCAHGRFSGQSAAAGCRYRSISALQVGANREPSVRCRCPAPPDPPARSRRSNIAPTYPFCRPYSPFFQTGFRQAAVGCRS